MTQTVRTDDGIAIEYKTYGSGPLTALFLHGWGNAASFWDDLFTTRLNLANLRCVAASYRGHGGSDHPTFGYTHDRFFAGHVRGRRHGWRGAVHHGRFQHGRQVRPVYGIPASPARAGTSLDRTAWPRDIAARARSFRSVAGRIA
jgi:pimeloyl-ACP methyl ester carboxylesterase